MNKKGIAVGYSPGNSAPEILAIAKGILVDKLINIAKENNITIYKDSDLAEILSLMTPGDKVPENLFHILSEVLAYCYRINDKFKEKVEKAGINKHS
jgi:flagellar biosynthesis protein